MSSFEKGADFIPKLGKVKTLEQLIEDWLGGDEQRNRSFYSYNRSNFSPAQKYNRYRSFHLQNTMQLHCAEASRCLSVSELDSR